MGYGNEKDNQCNTQTGLANSERHKHEIDPWAHRGEEMRCRTCMWFVLKEMSGPRPPGERRAVGRCRRHAPTMNGYPVVLESDWCGDHKLDENKVG